MANKTKVWTVAYGISGDGYTSDLPTVVGTYTSKEAAVERMYKLADQYMDVPLTRKEWKRFKEEKEITTDGYSLELVEDTELEITADAEDYHLIAVVEETELE